MDQRLDLDELEAEAITQGYGLDKPWGVAMSRRSSLNEVTWGGGGAVTWRSSLDEVVVELLDRASLGLLIKPARGSRVPGGWMGCWLAGQGRGSEVSSRQILICLIPATGRGCFCDIRFIHLGRRSVPDEFLLVVPATGRRCFCCLRFICLGRSLLGSWGG